MGTSKDLLSLELKNPPPTSSIESKLLVCKEDSVPQVPQHKRGQPDGKPITSPVPTSRVLDRVKGFLGVMEEANKRLQVDAKKSCKEFDIEELTGSESEYIEMELILGLADLHTPEAVAAAESAMAGMQPSIPLADSGDRSDSDDEDTDEDSDNSNKRPKSSSSKETLRNCEKKKRPKIVELP